MANKRLRWLIPGLTLLLLQCQLALLNRDADKVYDEVILGPMYAYNDAMRAYLRADYYKAFEKFSLVYHRYPSWHLNDKTLRYMGLSLYWLGMCEAADSLYKIGPGDWRIDDKDAGVFYGKLLVALGKNDCSAIPDTLASIRKSAPKAYDFHYGDLYRGIISLCKSDTTAAESLFVSLSTDTVKYEESVATRFFLARVCLRRNNRVGAVAWLQSAVAFIGKLDHDKADSLKSGSFFPLWLQDRQLVFPYIDDIGLPCTSTQVTAADQYTLLHLIVEYPEPDDFVEKKRRMYMQLQIDKLLLKSKESAGNIKKHSGRSCRANITDVIRELNTLE